MTESLQERNTRYLGYLVDIGVLDAEHYEALGPKCGDIKEKKLLFEISNVFANFTASDWFDLSCRMFTNWEKTPQVSENAKASNRSQAPPAELPREDIQEECEDDEEVHSVRIYGNQNRGERSLRSSAPPARDHESEQPGQAFDSSMMVKKLNYFCQVVEKYAYKSYFFNLKSHFDHFRSVVGEDTYESEEGDRVLVQRTNANLRPSERSSRNAGEREREWHNKLYFDHFQKQAQLEIKREIKKAGELDHCTFTPQVNPVDFENPVLANTLRVPVYERLLQAKPAPSNAMLEKHEYRELKGATFQPDISKSQRKWQTDYKGTPEDRMRVATERLYGDAQIKEKIMCLRQMNQKQQENQVYTFSPNLLSPKTNKENFAKTDLTRSVDRLYDENMKRQRKLLKKEVAIREQELEECTFQPDRLARNYRSKDSELDELNAHERLYERFKQKRERTNNFAERELSQRQENSVRLRSNSVLEGKTPSKSQKELDNVNTPAFDRLYKDMAKRKLKLGHLKDKIQKQEGTTFQPKTNWSRKSSRSISAANRSQQDIRFSSRYESAYAQ